MLWGKIAIMSDKAQTTRNKIMGIYTTDKEQIVFIDYTGYSQAQDSTWRFHGGICLFNLREVDTVSSWFQPMNRVARAMI